MKKPLFIRNIPIDENRISHIETVVSRMAVRLHKTTTGIITPHLISTCVAGELSDAILLKHMFFKGRITKGLLVFDKKPKNPIMVEFKLMHDTSGSSFIQNIEKKRIAFDIDLATLDGSQLTIRSGSITDENPVSEVHIAMLWIPDVSKAQVEQYLIDSLEEVARKEIENAL